MFYCIVTHTFCGYITVTFIGTPSQRIFVTSDFTNIVVNHTVSHASAIGEVEKEMTSVYTAICRSYTVSTILFHFSDAEIIL